MKRRISTFLISLSLLSLSAPSWATVIYVSGDQTGIWAADTVIVTAEVRVPPGESLTIQPGVEVLFSVYCKLIVDSAATLQAIGSLTDSIRFDVLPPDTAWHGIRFLSASVSSRLEYCLLTHGLGTGNGADSMGGAIYIGAPVTVGHCFITNCTSKSGGGIYIGHVETGNVTIEDCIIMHCSATKGGGLDIYSCGASVNILNCSITLNSAAGT